jgi:hypothetical protein
VRGEYFTISVKNNQGLEPLYYSLIAKSTGSILMYPAKNPTPRPLYDQYTGQRLPLFDQYTGLPLQHNTSALPVQQPNVFNTPLLQLNNPFYPSPSSVRPETIHKRSSMRYL